MRKPRADLPTLPEIFGVLACVGLVFIVLGIVLRGCEG